MDLRVHFEWNIISFSDNSTPSFFKSVIFKKLTDSLNKLVFFKHSIHQACLTYSPLAAYGPGKLVMQPKRLKIY